MPFADPEKRKEHSRARYQKKRERLGVEGVRAADRERYRAESPETRRARTERGRRWRAEHPEKMREVSNAARIKRAYGLTREGWAALNEAQGGRCAICRGEQQPHRDGTKDRLVVDHDHRTGRVRGLLCHNCNHAIGKMRDDPELLRAAIAYLEAERCTSG